MPLLTIQDLSVSFHQGSKVTAAVKQASFSIDSGEIVAVVGESGSGKTVTALSIMQLLPYPQASHPSGSIQFDGQELVNADAKTMQKVRGNDIAMIFQEPMTSLNPLHVIGKQIGEVLHLHHRLSKKATKKRIQELLTMVGMEKFVDQLHLYPHQLSGGQRQRIMIAMALACDPKILIADEPTTALDVTTQMRILALLKKLRDEHGLAIMLITHDLHLVRKMADKVCVMTKGEMVETANVKTIFKTPKHDYTKHLLSSEPKGSPVKVAKSQPTLIEANNLSVKFPKKIGFVFGKSTYTEAVKNASISVKKGHTLGIVGESGSGKTTLANGILRLVKSEGKIHFDGKEISQLKAKHIRPFRQDMQLVFQDPFASLNPRLTVAQLLEEGLKAHNLCPDKNERSKRVATALKQVQMDPDIADRYPHEFSGGQRQRLAIARAIILEPKLVVLDEPTSALDVSIQAELLDLLKKLQKDQLLSYFFISHDLRVVKTISHDIIVMRDGKIVEAGPAKEIFDKPKDDYTKMLMEAAFG